MKKNKFIATIAVGLTLVGGGIIFSQSFADAQSGPAVPAAQTATTNYSKYTLSYCSSCPNLAPNPAVVSAARDLGLNINSKAQGEYANIIGPDGKTVVASGEKKSTEWLQKARAEKEKPQTDFCVLITPGQSKDYGNKNVWGEPGVYKYKDPGYFASGYGGKYDARGGYATKEEDELNFKLRTGGKRVGGDEDRASYGQLGGVKSIDSEELKNGLGYLDKKTFDATGNYGIMYVIQKEETSYKSNEERSMVNIFANAPSSSPVPKLVPIKPNEAQAKEYIDSYAKDNKKAGYKHKGDKVMSPARYGQKGPASSVNAKPTTGQPTMNELDTYVSEQCEFRAPTDADKKTGGFPSTTPPGGSEGWPSSGNNGGGGGGGGGGSMDDMMKLLEALKGMAGQGGGGGQQPKSSPSAQPFYCPAMIAEVCGEDGNTYGNACIAEQENQIKVAYEGPCDLNRSQDSIVDNAAQLMRSAIASGIPKNLLEAITLSISKLIAQMLQGQFLSVTNIGQ